MQYRNLYLFQITAMDDKTTDFHKSSYFLPYTIGLLWSYAKTIPDISKNYQLQKLFWKPESEQTILNQIKSPDVVGFSNYLWNTETHSKLAFQIKKKYPECLIVFGGPNIPLDSYWLKDRPYIDLIVHQEGEITFSNILAQRLVSNNYHHVDGISINGPEVVKTPSATRIKNINEIPSPYLTGLFDDIVDNNPDTLFQATFETARGCPFKCSFCDWGGYTHQKMQKFEMDKIKEEVDWLSKNKIHALWFADSNTGIFKGRDLEIFKYISDSRNTFEFPKMIFVTGFSKTPPEKNDTLQIQKILTETGLPIHPRIAVQSFNDDTLKHIKRDNLNIYNIKDLNTHQKDNDIKAEIELIFPLPGTTYKSFVKDYEYMLSFENAVPMIYCCLLLPRSEMATPSYRKNHGLIGTQMPFNSKGEKCEIVTSTNDITQEEVTKCWMLSWVIYTFWYSSICVKLFKKLSLMYDMKIIDICLLMQNFIETDNSNLSFQYNDMKNKMHSDYKYYNIRDIVGDNISCHLFNDKNEHLNKTELVELLIRFVSKEFNQSTFLSKILIDETLHKSSKKRSSKKYNPMKQSINATI
tara:strand:- start:1792 stop:3534 length:1743 start_codon:yes stop_codon:yes gene_type:complete